MRVKSWAPENVITMARVNATTRLEKLGSEMVAYIKNQMENTTLDYMKPYVYEDGLHFPSKAGEFPAVWYGDLYKALEYKVVTKGNGIVLLVGVNLDQEDQEGYAIWLEYGTAKMKARPWLEPTLFMFEDRLKEVFAV
jgi:hypothetical protein